MDNPVIIGLLSWFFPGAGHIVQKRPVRGAIIAAVVWLMFWAYYVFLGHATPIEPEAFKLVAALDTVLIVPALVIGGALLLRRHPWSYVMACVAGVQASLYLIVLVTNAFLFVRLGPADWPGELGIWGPLAASATAMTVWLFSNASQPGEV